MAAKNGIDSSRNIYSTQLILLFGILATLIILILVPYGFSNFLLGLSEKSNVMTRTLSLTLTASVIGIIFALLYKLGMQSDYKEDDSFPNSKKK